MTQRVEISRLLAIFNTLSENDKNLVLIISELIKKPETAPIQRKDGTFQISVGKDGVVELL